MPHRRSHGSATAFLTALLLLALAAPVWAQGGDEPVSSDDPTAQQGAGENPAGAEGSDPCPGRQSVSDGRGGCERDRDCEEDFRFQEEAQRFFRSRGGPDADPHDLDDDSPAPDDGIACESLPSEDDGGSSGGDDSDDDTPSGGVASGYGPPAPTRAAATTDDSLPFGLLVGGTLLGLAMLAAAVTRRRERS